MLPVRTRLLRATQKVSSYSIHTLLLADANKIGEPKLSDHKVDFRAVCYTRYTECAHCTIL